MVDKINIIDLFAGPGGLGEGFSSFSHINKFPFQIKASIEKDESAHKTLTLRAFIRKFLDSQIPDEYYEYLQNPDLGLEFLAKLYPEEWKQATEETMEHPRELGTKDDEVIFKRLREIKKNNIAPFVVIGGPPCQAYSVIGRIKNSSINDYVAEEDHRHFLYKEYLKVLDIIKPEVFVMENVRGIITAKLEDKRFFPLILDDLKCPAKANGKKKGKKYRIYSLSSIPDSFTDDDQPVYKSDQKFVIKSEDYGVPQKRHRVILLGIREDIAQNITPEILAQTSQVYTNHVLDGMPRLRSSVSRQKNNKELWLNTVKSEGEALVKILSENCQSKLSNNISKIISTLSIPKKQSGNKRFLLSNSKSLKNTPSNLKEFIEDSNLKGYLNHFARSHMKSDLQRYLFCSAFAQVNKKRKIPSPTKKDFPEDIAPNHQSWESGKFADRFRVQFKGSPASTITSHINRDGHYFIHYDPSQCRSLSVREAARLQTFPDNYFFEGNQTQQYIQVGNAVPPFLAIKIAKIVHKLLLNQAYQ